MSISFEGYESILEDLTKIADTERVVKAVKKACLDVEGTAKPKAPMSNKSGDSQHLRNTITSEVTIKSGEIIGKVYTPLEYAPYVEYGTGIHAEKGGRSGWWVYVADSSYNGTKGNKRNYTKEEALEVMAYLREQGLEAYATNGRDPKPFLRPALYENREKILKRLREAISTDD